MVTDSLSRYKNLLKHIQNWPLYFLRKFRKEFRPMQLTTRGNKLSFNIPSTAEYLVFKEIFVTDFYNIDQLVNQLPTHPVIIDIGGNIGYFEMILFSKIKTASLYAYEPIPSNYALFNKNIALNPGLQNNIQLFNKAVTGTAQASVELFLESATENSVIASVYKDFDKQNKYSIKVPAISLEQIVQENKLESIDLVKIDCEGSEYPIIFETSPAVWKKIKKLVIEVHNLDNEKRNVNYLANYLQANGYTVDSFPAHSNCYFLQAVQL